MVPPARIAAVAPNTTVATSALEAARGTDAVIVATDWPEFREIDLVRLAGLVAQRLIVDGRNFLDPEKVRAAGFEYRCLGRPAVEGGPISIRARLAVVGGAE